MREQSNIRYLPDKPIYLQSLFTQYINQDVRDNLDDKLDIAKEQFGDEIQLAKNKIVQKVNEI